MTIYVISRPFSDLNFLSKCVEVINKCDDVDFVLVIGELMSIFYKDEDWLYRLEQTLYGLKLVIENVCKIKSMVYLIPSHVTSLIVSTWGQEILRPFVRIDNEVRKIFNPFTYSFEVLTKGKDNVNFVLKPKVVNDEYVLLPNVSSIRKVIREDFDLSRFKIVAYLDEYTFSNMNSLNKVLELFTKYHHLILGRKIEPTKEHWPKNVNLWYMRIKSLYKIDVDTLKPILIELK